MYVEFLGIPRERAGIAELHVDADTLGQLLRTLVASYPGLRDLINDAAFHPSVAANLNGDAFVTDPGTRFSPNDHLLILSADVGG